MFNQKSFFLKAYGNSMKPFFQDGDIVFYKKITYGQIKVSDVISLKRESKFITHRVVYKTDKYLVTKGDNNLESDGKIYPKQIAGRVYQVKRHNKVFNPEDLYLVQSTLYFKEIVKIKKALERKKVDFVYLKGLPLHLYYENKHPRRIYADCDVLVSQKDKKKMEDVLISAGYRQIDDSLTKSQRKLRDRETETNFHKNIANFPVIFDVHFEASTFIMPHLGSLKALYPQRLIDGLTNEYLTEKRTIKVNKVTFSILSPKNLVIFLSLHIFHHNFCGAFRYQFLDTVIRKSKLKYKDWQLVIEKIRDYRLNDFIYPVFVLLKKYYKTPLPVFLFDQIKPVHFYTYSVSDKINIFDGEYRTEAGITRFKNLFFLSPNPIWKKLLVFIKPRVFMTIFLLAGKKVMYYIHQL